MHLTSSIGKRWFHYGVFVLLAWFSVSLPTGTIDAQEKYPSRNIDLVIAFGAGGTTDLNGRIFADELSKVLNVTVVPSNKPGATGGVGSAHVLKSKKDGYTLLLNTISGMVLAHHLLPDIPFDTLRDFIPICMVAVSPCLLVSKSDSAIKSFEDLLSLGKKSPGKFTYGHVGPGSDVHLVMEQLQDAANIKLAQVPFKGGGETLTAVLGGHVDLGSILMATAATHLKAGTVRGIAISGNKRVQAFPDIPTYGDKGFPQHFFTNWSGVFVPAGTPPTVINTLVEASEKVLKSKSFVNRIEELGTQVEYLKPTEFKKYIEADDQVAGALIEKLGLKVKK